MTIKASGRLALIMAAGLFVCFAGPWQVAVAKSGGATASNDDNATGVKKQNTRHSKRDTPRKSAKTESTQPEAKSSDVADAAATPALPASIANANAELTPGAPADAASATSKANTLLAGADKPGEAGNAGDANVVAPDQLNELDRALQENQSQNQPASQPAQQPAPAVAMMTAQAPEATAASADDTTWDRTSLIGKIFIAAGALLTMASAARMFMA